MYAWELHGKAGEFILVGKFEWNWRGGDIGVIFSLFWLVSLVKQPKQGLNGLTIKERKVKNLQLKSHSFCEL